MESKGNHQGKDGSRRDVLGLEDLELLHFMSTRYGFFLYNWEEVIRMSLRERRVSQDLARDRLSLELQHVLACKTDI